MKKLILLLFIVHIFILLNISISNAVPFKLRTISKINNVVEYPHRLSQVEEITTPNSSLHVSELYYNEDKPGKYNKYSVDVSADSGPFASISSSSRSEYNFNPGSGVTEGGFNFQSDFRILGNDNITSIPLSFNFKVQGSINASNFFTEEPLPHYGSSTFQYFAKTTYSNKVEGFASYDTSGSLNLSGDIEQYSPDVTEDIAHFDIISTLDVDVVDTGRIEFGGLITQVLYMVLM